MGDHNFATISIILKLKVLLKAVIVNLKLYACLDTGDFLSLELYYHC